MVLLPPRSPRPAPLFPHTTFCRAPVASPRRPWPPEPLLLSKVGLGRVAAHHALAVEVVGDVADRLLHHPAPASRVGVVERQDSAFELIIEGDRKSVVWGKSVSVRVDIDGRRIIKIKTRNSINYKQTRQSITHM